MVIASQSDQNSDENICGCVRGPVFCSAAVLADQRHGCGAEPGCVRACDEEAEAEGDALQGAQAHRLPGGHVQQPAGGFQVRGRQHTHCLRHPRHHQEGAYVLYYTRMLGMLRVLALAFWAASITRQVYRTQPSFLYLASRCSGSQTITFP